MSKQGAASDNLFELAMNEISKLPMKPAPGQTNYQTNLIRALKQLNDSNQLEFEKEKLLIALLERVVVVDRKEINENRKELTAILQLLKETRDKKLKSISRRAPPQKSALKKEGGRKKGINAQFDLGKNTEASFFLEEGRALSASTEQFKQEEREKYRAKRTPNEKGEVQLRSFGDNPPRNPLTKPYKGQWLSDSNLKELQEYFESLKNVEAANLTVNQDGTYKVEIYNKNKEYPTRADFDLDEMYQLLFGNRFEKYLRNALGDNHPVKFSHSDREDYALLDFKNLDDDKLVAVLTLLLELNIEIKNDDIEPLENNKHRIHVTHKDILNALIDHHSLLEDIKDYYEKTLQLVQGSPDKKSTSAIEPEQAKPEKSSPRR